MVWLQLLKYTSNVSFKKKKHKEAKAQIADVSTACPSSSGGGYGIYPATCSSRYYELM
jgi:hypothetical protein